MHSCHSKGLYVFLLSMCVHSMRSMHVRQIHHVFDQIVFSLMHKWYTELRLCTNMVLKHSFKESSEHRQWLGEMEISIFRILFQQEIDGLVSTHIYPVPPVLYLLGIDSSPMFKLAGYPLWLLWKLHEKPQCGNIWQAELTFNRITHSSN